MDRFDDMRARVSGSGGGGSESGGGGPFGVDVMVQATDNFSAGDTFVGTAVSGMNPKIARVASGLSNVGHVSADGSVAIKNGAVSSTSTSITIYIKNEDAYTEVVVPLPDMTGATTCQTGYTSKTVSVNENGSIIILNMKTFLLKISVGKKSLTAIAERIEPSSVSLSNYPYDGMYAVTVVDFTSSAIFVRDDYLFFGVTGSYEQNGSIKSTSYAMYGEIVGSSITNEYKLGTTVTSYCSGVNDYNGNDLIFLYGSGFRRLEISSGKVVSDNNISQSVNGITQNGEYAYSGTKIYKINQETGTCTQVKTISYTPNAIDETGEYYIYNNKCYRTSNNASLGSMNYPTGSSYFKIVDDSFICYGNYVNTLVPSEGAEYTIAHTTSVSTAGDIYGVVTKSMTMGEIKKALKIFNK